MSSLLHALLYLSGVGLTLAVYPYYGKLVQMGWGTQGTQDLQGDIYIVDDTRFQIIGFIFTVSDFDAAFMVGTSSTYQQISAGNGMDTSAIVLANPNGQMQPLRSYSNENIVLTVPNGMTVAGYKYIAVGKIDNKELIGGADIPVNIEVPMPVMVGEFARYAHQVSSGPVTVINDRTIKIDSLSYDGLGPDAFFYVGITDRVQRQTAPYGKIADENGVIDRKAVRYNMKDIMLTLPDTISVTDLKWISMYCISYRDNFGDLFFNQPLNVPPYLETEMDEAGSELESVVNCEPLSDDLQVRWKISEDSITIGLSGRIDRNSAYMAFGLSGSTERAAMVGADVVVVDYKEDREPRAIDYHLQQKSQCSSSGGVCPDTSEYNSATNDAMQVSGTVRDGITTVMYERALTTGDVAGGQDKQYKTDGTPQQIVWAVGPLNSRDQAAKHYSEGGVIRESKTINFARSGTDNCPIFEDKDKVELPQFKPHHLYGKEGTVFTAEIGPSASEQGYKAITGSPSWGISWYINGIIVPELHLKRGVAYTFRVAGGTNTSLSSKYHPLYFTDSPVGGYSWDGESEGEQPESIIYQAMEGGENKDFAVGGFCEWILADLSKETTSYNCFEELKADLKLQCDDNTIGYTEFIFTPTDAMPDTIYYQCYTHINLGWKINLYDELPTSEIPDQDCTATSTPSATVATETRKAAETRKLTDSSQATETTSSSGFTQDEEVDDSAAGSADVSYLDWLMCAFHVFVVFLLA